MKTKYALALMIVAGLATGPAIADKPATAGAEPGDKQRGQPEHAQGKPSDADKRQDTDQRQDAKLKGAAAPGPRGGIDDQQRAAVREYYSGNFRNGHCPPGLAKKDNGCMPPGLAKNWALGQQLPREAIFHDLPESLAAQIGQPPSGHRFVRVADDILLITSGTGLVVDAIPALGMN